ncbi:MAG: ectonucleotide pyrophosphatase/phosphodiesterase [Gemmatimonadales bacterium]
MRRRLLALLSLGTATACRPPAPPAPDPGRLVLLVSLDGFRPDYLDRPEARRLRQLADSGVRAEYLAPAFPTKTFPNLYTIATGLYPEHHGIVANTMVDSVLGRFTTADTVTNRKPGWWKGEPIWITAGRQGRRTATMFWVGSEVAFDGRHADHWRPFEPFLPGDARVDQLTEWLSLPEGERPQFATLYLNRVDVMGHRHGPDSPAVDSAIAVTDSTVGRLVDWLTAAGLAPRTDLVIVSDHGMTGISPDRVIFLDDYVPIEPGDIVDLAPVTALEPAANRVETVSRKLQGAHPHLTVYRREEMPARFHFRANDRITSLVLLADDGWTISTRALWRDRPLRDDGNHGYDNALPSMRATFLAVGPSFRRGAVVPPFQNIHVYDLLAHLLGVRPAPNDGSLDSVRAVLRNPGGR